MREGETVGGVGDGCGERGVEGTTGRCGGCGDRGGVLGSKRLNFRDCARFPAVLDFDHGVRKAGAKLGGELWFEVSGGEQIELLSLRMYLSDLTSIGADAGARRRSPCGVVYWACR